MTGNVVGKARGFLVRALAVAAVLWTYTLGTIGTQLASIVGVSSLAVSTTATPAQAQYRYRRGYRRRYRRRWW
jgi:hypothetical protein